MKKLSLFILGILNMNCSFLLISCDNNELMQDEEDEFVHGEPHNQTITKIQDEIDETIMQGFINELKKLKFELSSTDLESKIHANVLNKINTFIKQNPKYENIRVTIEKIDKFNNTNYIISLISVLQTQQDIKFASTLKVFISNNEENEFATVRQVENIEVEEQEPVNIESEIDFASNQEGKNQLPISQSSKKDARLATTQPFIATQESDEQENVKQDELFVLLDEQVILVNQNKNPEILNIDYQEKLTILQKELMFKIFDYDQAETKFADFITNNLVPWFNQRLINLNYKLILDDFSLNEIVGNTYNNFILHIVLNNENVEYPLLIKLNCKEKINNQTSSILNFVWEETKDLMEQNVNFENLPVQPTHGNVIEELELILRNKFSQNQNFNLIFKGIKENNSKNSVLQKGNNVIYFTLAIDNKSFYSMNLKYIF